jgi:hypothetical protein
VLMVPSKSRNTAVFARSRSKRAIGAKLAVIHRPAACE